MTEKRYYSGIGAAIVLARKGARRDDYETIGSYDDATGVITTRDDVQIPPREGESHHAHIRRAVESLGLPYEVWPG